jgi:Ca2+-binding EF-hand superfamily protein
VKEEEVRRSFRFFLRKYDAANSGVLSTPHFRIILTQMGSGSSPMSEEQISAALREIDPEDRGYVDEEAFTVWVNQNRS